MKYLGDATNATTPTARLCVDVGIGLVRLLRRAYADAPDTTLTLSAVRALRYVRDNAAASLRDVARHLSVGAPTASKLVDDLVARGLVTRSAARGDRRRLALSVTQAGRNAVRQASRPAEVRLNELLERLSVRDRKAVRTGMEKLLPLLTAAGGESADG